MNKRVVMVRWVDSCSSSNLWSNREDIEEAKPLECLTIGFVVWETESHLTLAASLSNDGDQVAGDMCIPQPCIIEITEVWSDDEHKQEVTHEK